MSDGKIIIDTQIDSAGAEKGVKKLSTKLGSLASGGLATFAKGVVAAGTAMAGAGIASIKLASDLSEVQNVVDVTFGSNASKINDWAKNAATSFGLSELSAKQMTGTLGAMMKSMGLNSDQVLNMSESMVGLAGDFASFYNLKPEEAFEKIRAGISGETEPLKQLGINMSVANLNAYALSQGINKTYDSMTQAEQATLRYNYLMSVSKDAQGDFARTSNSLANQLRIAKLNLQDLGATIGNSLLPMAKDATATLNTMAGELKTAFDKGGFDGLANSLGGVIAQIITNISQQLPKVIDLGVKIVQSLISGIQKNLPQIAQSFVQVASSIVSGFLTTIPQFIALGIQMIGELANGIGLALPTLIPLAAQTVTSLLDNIVLNLPMLIDGGLQIINGLVQGMLSALPILIEQFPQIINNLVLAINYGLPQILQAGVQLLQALVDGIIQNLPILISELPQIITTIVSIISENLPQITDSAISIVTTLIDGVLEELPQLINMLPQIITTVVDVITDNLPQIVDAGVEILLALINGLVDALPQLIDMLPDIINTVVITLAQHLPEIIDAGIKILIALIGGILQTIPQLIGALPQVINSILEAFENVDWISIGANILAGIGEGIISGIGSVLDAAGNACTSIKDKFKEFFNIHSPSRLMRDEVGKNIALGIAKGIEMYTNNVVSAVEKLSVAAYNEGLAKADSYSELGTFYIDSLKKGVENRKTLLLDAFKKTVDDGVATFVSKNKASEEQYKAAGDSLVKAYTNAIEDGTNEALNEITDNISSITEEFQKLYDDLIRQREDLQNKLSGFGDMFRVDEDGDVHLNNIKKQTQAITEYGNLLNSLKERGVSADFLSQITSLDVDQGTKVIEELLKLNDKEFVAYTSAWETKQLVAKKLAEDFYAEQLTTLDTNFNNKIDQAMVNVPTTMQNIGQQAMNGFMNGMDSQMTDLIQKSGDIAQSVLDTFTKAFDIHSPSRVFKNLIGKNLVKGMEVGITTEAPSLLNSASDLCKQLQASVDYNTARTTANIAASANKAANVSNSTTTITESDNGPKVYIDKFIGNDESNVVQLAQEIAFLDKRKPN